MRQDLDAITAELQKHRKAKKDFTINPAEHLKMSGGLIYMAGKKKPLMPTEVFHEDLIDKLKIPGQYYKRMREERPELLDASVNQWMQLHDKNSLIRTYDFADKSIARALLSDSYKAIDNYDVLFAALDAIEHFCKKQKVKVVFDDCGLTERRMYVRMTCPDIELKAPELLKNYINPKTNKGGNPAVITGLQITNSEVGQGAFQIMPRALILACSNGLMRKSDAFRKVHLGGKLDEEQEIVWSNETLKKNLDLIVSQVGDAVKEFLSKDYLTRVVNYYTNKGSQLLQHPIPCVNNITEHLGYSDDRRGAILDYFTKSKDFSKFGAVQALTFEAHETSNDDLMYEAEMNAFNVFEEIGKFDKFSDN